MCSSLCHLRPVSEDLNDPSLVSISSGPHGVRRPQHATLWVHVGGKLGTRSHGSYRTRSLLHEHTPRIKVLLKVLDGAWKCSTSEVAWELFHSSNPYLHVTVPCTIGNF
jgi:hypothetical protein